MKKIMSCIMVMLLMMGQVGGEEVMATDNCGTIAENFGTENFYMF